MMSEISKKSENFAERIAAREAQKWKADLAGPIRRLSNFSGLVPATNGTADGLPVLHSTPVKPNDESKSQNSG